MKFNFPVKETVTKRYSVRNYSEQPIEEDKQKLIRSYIDNLENPLGKSVNFHYLNNEGMENEERLGTYGLIKGAKNYIGTTITMEPMALEALGYEFEAMVLYLAHLDIGTCWLGGTFDREGFANAMEVNEGEIFPIITPYGYAADHKHEKELEVRAYVQADKRIAFDSLFFNKDFEHPLTEESAGDYAFALEMVRLAPSASNKQPWRLVVDGDTVHFFEYKEPGYSDRLPYDIQRVDMGIAAAHFEAALQEKDVQGSYSTESKPSIELPEHVEYVFSWSKN